MKKYTPLLLASVCSFALPTIQQESTISQLKELERADESFAGPKYTKPQVKKAGVIKNAEKVKFVLKGIVFSGKSPIPEQEMQQVFAKYLNKKISVQKLHELVQELSNTFMSKGYILSKAYIPKQKSKNGIIKISIIAGHFKSYTIAGNPPANIKAKIDELIKPVMREHPMNTKTLENALLTINQIPGCSVRSIISPHKNIDQAAHLTLVTEVKDSYFSAHADNYLNRVDGSVRLDAELKNYDVFPGSELGIRASQTVNPEVSHYIILNSKFPLGLKGNFVNFSYTSLKNRPNYSAIGFTIDTTGRSKIWRVSVTHPIINTRLYSQNIFFDLKKANTTLESTTAFDDRIAAFDIGSSWSFLGPKFSKSNIAITWEHGLGSAFGAGKTTQNLSRQDGSFNFNKFNLHFKSSKFINPIMNASIDVYAQTSYDVLLAPEEFAFGGRYCGIGYDPSEMMGDDGYCVHKQLNILLPKPNKVGLKNWYAFAFHDNGIIKNRTIDTSTALKRDEASSFGLGLGMQFNSKIHAKLLYGLPLDHDIGLENNRKGRLFFNVSYHD